MSIAIRKYSGFISVHRNAEHASVYKFPETDITKVYRPYKKTSRRSDMKRKNTCIRLCFYISGLILFSFGISVTIYANIGVSSWDAVSVGLNKLYGCSIGTWMNLISICQIIAGGILGYEGDISGKENLEELFMEVVRENGRE